MPASPGVAPKEAGPRSIRELITALADVLPFALLITGTLGGIYAGLVTTTEGATIGCTLAIVLGALWGDLTLRGFVEAVFNTIKFSGNILFIIFTAYVFSYAISFAGVGERRRFYTHPITHRSGADQRAINAPTRATGCG